MHLRTVQAFVDNANGFTAEGVPDLQTNIVEHSTQEIFRFEPFVCRAIYTTTDCLIFKHLPLFYHKKEQLMATKTKRDKANEAHVYFPPKVYEALRKLAETNRRTLSAEIVIAVEKHLTAK